METNKGAFFTTDQGNQAIDTDQQSFGHIEPAPKREAHAVHGMGFVYCDPGTSGWGNRLFAVTEYYSAISRIIPCDKSHRISRYAAVLPEPVGLAANHDEFRLPLWKKKATPFFSHFPTKEFHSSAPRNYRRLAFGETQMMGENEGIRR